MFVCYSIWSQEDLSRTDAAYNVRLVYVCTWRLVLTVYTTIIYFNVLVPFYVANVEEFLWSMWMTLRHIEVL